MITRENILSIVYESIDYLNDLNDTSVEASESEPLIGGDSELDSLDFVEMIVDIEQRLSDGYGISVSITSERAMSQHASPFKTVGTLADYVLKLTE